MSDSRSVMIDVNRQEQSFISDRSKPPQQNDTQGSDTSAA